MAQTRIAIVVGSLRRDSFNRKLAEAVKTLFPAGYEFTLPRIDDLPPYNQDDDDNNAEPVKRLKAEITAAQALIFITPEYNRSMPGVLKNAIDHASRPYGKSVWKLKPAGVMGISVGAAGTCMAQQHLRNVLAYLDVPTLGQPEVFLQAREDVMDKDGKLSASTRQFLEGWAAQYMAFVKRHVETPGL